MFKCLKIYILATSVNSVIELIYCLMWSEYAKVIMPSSYLECTSGWRYQLSPLTFGSLFQLIYLLSQAATILTITCLHIFQFFEWISMLTIIVSEQGRKLEEIMFDHNNQGVIDYRKIEKGVLWAFFAVFTIHFSFTAYNQVINVIDRYQTFEKPYTLIKIWLGAWILVNFIAVCIVGCKMWTRHRYEFRKSIKGFVSFYVCFTGMIVYITLIENQESKLRASKFTLNEYADECDQLPAWVLVAYALLYILPMVNCLVYLKLKNDDDVLQGISKLDYLLKVSRFQIYKDRDLRQRWKTNKSRDSDSENKSMESMIKYRN